MRFVSIGLISILGFSSCQRSPAYKHDQEYSGADSASYYNDHTGKAPMERVQSQGQPKKRVVVFNFWNATPVKQAELGAYAADELKRGLYLTRRLILPTDARSDLNTEDFLQGDRVKMAQLIREGRSLGVAVLVIGRISKVVFRQRGDDVGLLRQKQSLAAAEVELKIYDVQTGREVMATSKSGEASSNAMVVLEDSDIESPQFRGELTKVAVRNAVSSIVPDVIRAVEKLAWQGRIAKIMGTKVYVNAGKASGMVVGDILKVMAPGDDIYDPATGAYLGRTQGQLKGTLEVVDFIGPDGATTEVHTGGNFQESDVVQLY